MARPPGSVYQFSADLLDGRPESLATFRGRVLLIVNTASRCGFTDQYRGLQALYEGHREQGFEVLGFPSNQFGRQEPGSAAEIRTFCDATYGITFPMFAKIDVNGPRAHPLFQFLRLSRPGMFGALWEGRIRWNFTKFLVDRSGTVVARFAPSTTPAALRQRIEKLLTSD
jgi:glutathione peroxidase